MICPKCKSEIKDDSKFCGKCGQKIPRCPTCGRPILERARFCVYDGTMIPDDMLNLLPEETAEDITENQEQQERREQAVVKKTGRQKKKKVFVVLGIILGVVACAGVGYAAVHALSGKKNVDQKQEQKIAREEKKETTAVPEKISESSKSKQKTDQDEIASVSENTTENQETDTKVKTKSETEYAETEENKKAVSESKEETSTVSESKAPQIIHTYEVIAGDLSWEDAKNACEERGGYLATITSEEEYEKIGEMADRSGLTYLWLARNCSRIRKNGNRQDGSQEKTGPLITGIRENQAGRMRMEQKSYFCACGKQNITKKKLAGPLMIREMIS